MHDTMKILKKEKGKKFNEDFEDTAIDVALQLNNKTSSFVVSYTNYQPSVLFN